MLPSKVVLSNWQLAKICMFAVKVIIFQVIRSQRISDIKCQKFSLTKPTAVQEVMSKLISFPQCPSAAAPPKRKAQTGWGGYNDQNELQHGEQHSRWTRIKKYLFCSPEGG